MPVPDMMIAITFRCDSRTLRVLIEAGSEEGTGRWKVVRLGPNPKLFSRAHLTTFH